METQKGIIITLVVKRRFGFIRGDDGTDVFFHAAGVIDPEYFDDLREGHEVNYCVVNDPDRRPKAIGVVVV